MPYQIVLSHFIGITTQMITFPVTNNRVHPRRTLHQKIHVNSAYLWFKIQLSIYTGFAQLKTD